MASDRAVKFAEMQVWADGDEPQSLWVGGRSVAISDTRDWIDVAQAKVAVSEMLDAYEREAWVAVTEDLASRPPNGRAVLIARELGQVEQASYSSTERVWFLDGCDLDEADGERPTHWRPLPAGPGGGK